VYKKDYLMQDEPVTSSYTAEKRKIPRTGCLLTDISSKNKNIAVVSIENISPEGCLLNFKGELCSGDKIDLEFRLPDNSRSIEATGMVSYVIKNFFKGINSAGVLFTGINDIDQKRIFNFIVSTASSSALKNMQETISEEKINNKYKISSPGKINTLLNQIKNEKIFLTGLFENSQKVFEFSINRIDPQDQVFTTSNQTETVHLVLGENHPSYFSFYFQGGSYYFKTVFIGYDDGDLIFEFPLILFQLEKRAYNRHVSFDNVPISIHLDEMSNRQFQGKVIDISSRGFLCEFLHNKLIENTIKTGQVINYSLNNNSGLGSYGEIRHIKKKKLNGSSVLQIGVEAGIKRSDFIFEKVADAAWKNKKIQRELSSTLKQMITSRVVTYNNSQGKKITALVNYTEKDISAPVIILPPAFGKKKETLSPLVSTLITNYRNLNTDIVTIRYDGINRPGESYNKEMFPKRGYEMLHYKISQGLDDLKSTLAYVYDNPLFKPGMVILVAFSMSALDARKIMNDQNNGKIDYLINVMGATCGQSSFGNVTGGLDIIGNARMGIQSGLTGVLGHLLDVDTIARDLIDNKYAYITDARLDMSKISTPVTWIYGKYDRWIPKNEIIDIMSVKSDGMREVIEIPTGHNLRSSDDALKTFMLITKLIYRMQFKQEIDPVAPDRENMVKLITYERERLENTEEFRPVDYWKHYLIGQGNSVGYDFYKNIKEFREFLTLQSELVDLKNGEVFADIGCGTGIFIENMLLNLAGRKKNINDSRLVLVDLVREALDKSKAKCETIFHSYEALVPKKIEYIQMDLDPNRLIPVKKFMTDGSLDFNFLRNRIEGLMNTTIDRLLQNASARLYAIMKGSVITPDDSACLKDNFSDELYETIVEFNRAARFVSKNLFVHDLIDETSVHQGVITDDDYLDLRTSDLIFKHLNFSNNGLDLNLNFRDSYFDKIAASLFISYLYNPDDIMYDFYRMLKPGGRLLVSSMKPDSDISLIFTDYIDKVWKFDLADTDIKNQEMNLTAARAMLNEAAGLFELEEEGYFRFYSEKELVSMFENAGFKHISVTTSLGKPEQAVIITGEKPWS
jgi:ubiquinone/menaquinone biosynthesis C-methylase UbiE